MQIIAFCFYLRLTHRPFFGIGLYKKVERGRERQNSLYNLQNISMKLFIGLGIKELKNTIG